MLLTGEAVAPEAKARSFQIRESQLLLMQDQELEQARLCAHRAAVPIVPNETAPARLAQNALRMQAIEQKHEDTACGKSRHSRLLMAPAR